MTIETFLVLTAVALLLYPVLLRRLAVLVEPLRQEMMDLGEKLLENPSLTERQRANVRWSLDFAYSGWLPAVWVFTAPFVTLLGLVLFKFFAAMHKIEEREGGEGQRAYDRYQFLSTVSVAARNPFFALIVAIEMIPILALIILLGGGRTLLRRSLSLTTMLERNIFDYLMLHPRT